jgi:hypothetical protein
MTLPERSGISISASNLTPFEQPMIAMRQESCGWMETERGVDELQVR